MGPWLVWKQALGSPGPAPAAKRGRILVCGGVTFIPPLPVGALLMGDSWGFPAGRGRDGGTRVCVSVCVYRHAHVLHDYMNAFLLSITPSGFHFFGQRGGV